MIHSSLKVGSLIKHKNSGAILKISKINPKSAELVVVKVDDKTPKYLKVNSKDIVSVEKMSKINFNKFYENVDKIEESSSKKYSTVEKTKRGFTVIIPYPDEGGIETLDGLYDWESKDSSNRRVLNPAKDKQEAEKLIKDHKIFENQNSILESFISFDEFLVQEAKVYKLKEGEFYTYTGGAETMKVKYIGRRENHKDLKVGSSMGKGFVFEWPEGDKFFELGHQSIKDYIHDDLDSSTSHKAKSVSESKILNDKQALELIKKIKDIVPDAGDAVEEYVVGTLGKSKLSTIERILSDYDLTLDDLDESLSESLKWKPSKNSNVEGYVAKSFPHSKGDGDRLLEKEVLRKKWSNRLTKWLGIEIDLKDVKDFFTGAYKEFGFTFKDKDDNEYRIYSPGEGPKSQEYHVQKLKK